MRRLTASLLASLLLPVAMAVAADLPPGERIIVDPANLPPPDATRSIGNFPATVQRRPEQAPRVLPGFRATLFADRLEDARNLAVAPNGDVFLAEPGAGRVTVLRASNGGAASERSTFAEGLEAPFGMAFRPEALYVADLLAVWRFPYHPGDLKASGPRRRVTAEGALGTPDGHVTRNLAFSPDGSRFYVAIGSRGNIDEEPAPRATVQEFGADGREARIFASGLRNPVGLAFYPGTTDLYAVVNERDGLGDGLVPDYLTRLQPGGFYGWPYSYIGQHPQPGALGTRRPDLVRRAIVPDLLLRSHSAPLGLAFYTGTQFPEEYRGDAFIALHGSWNSSRPTGYDVVRVHFRDGRPTPGYEVFASGFWIDGEQPARVWGRPVGVAVAKDGSLLIAEDAGNTIWRISYAGR